MAYTQAQLIADAYRQATLDSGTAATEDVTAITTELAGILADLQGRRRVSSTVTLASIPDALFPHLATVVAERIRPLFYNIPTDFSRLQEAEAQLVLQNRLDRTQSALVLAVLEQLQAYGQTNSAIDGTTVAARIPGILAELSARDIIFISDVDGVPDEAMPALIRYIAASLSVPQLIPVMNMAAADLRDLSPRLETQTLETEYF